MAICKLCSSIPLDDKLPSLPVHLWGHQTGWRYIHQFFAQLSTGKPCGFPFHPSLESLQSSAESCDLCRLILDSVEKAIEELRNPNKKNLRLGHPSIPKKPTWNLWLTKRQELGDGFCVFTNCEDSEDFCFVAAVGVCVKDDDPLASSFTGRVVEQDPSSSITLERIRSWIEQCTCTAELPLLPTRLIDVGHDSNDYCVKLCEIEDQNGKYISLSHCWGKATQFTTTKASIAAHQTNINYDELPKSFQDAIQITRLLGVRYIWIDSICICQDDGEDWERESAKMQSIYMNSYLTIAASAAKDSSIGCFIPRRSIKYVSIPYSTKQGIRGELQAFLLPMRKEAIPELYLDMADNIDEVDHPLMTRAWAVQERVLPRRTLHFGKHQMYFECNKGFRGENGLKVPRRFHSIHSIEQGTERNEIFAQWNSMLRNYGPRSLTEPSDKIPAISGLAGLFAERLDDEYVAGLWRKFLIEGLLWLGSEVHRVPKWRAPSWSWTSCDGDPIIRTNEKLEPLAEILECKVELKGKHIFGEVKSGWIKIQAPLVPLILDPRVDPAGTGHPYDNNPNVRTEKGDLKGCYSRFDFDFIGPTGREEGIAIVESLKGIEIFALILAKKLTEDYDLPKIIPADHDEIYRCLIVRPSEVQSNALERVGVVNMTKETLGECSQLAHKDERPIITLI